MVTSPTPSAPSDGGSQSHSQHIGANVPLPSTHIFPSQAFILNVSPLLTLTVYTTTSRLPALCISASCLPAV